jgi:hypothetical protein
MLELARLRAYIETSLEAAGHLDWHAEWMARVGR